MRCFGSTILGKIKSEKGKRENKTDGHWTLRDGSCGKIWSWEQKILEKKYVTSNLYLVGSCSGRFSCRESRYNSDGFQSFHCFSCQEHLGRRRGTRKVTPVIFFGLGGTWLRSPWMSLRLGWSVLVVHTRITWKRKVDSTEAFFYFEKWFKWSLYFEN